MKKLTWLIIVVIVVGGVYWWMQGSPVSAPVENVPTVPANSITPEPAAPTADANATGAAMTATVSYNGTAFTPAEVTIKKGGTVTFTSTSTSTSTGADMWVATAQHPEHTGYAGTTRTEHCPDAAGVAFDQCIKGSAYTFTFEKTGTWPYHNHMKLGAYGKVIVVE